MSSQQTPPQTGGSPKFCINCQHYTRAKGTQGDCAHPRAAVIDLVIGPKKPSCFGARLRDSACGLDGLLFAERVADSVGSKSQAL